MLENTVYIGEHVFGRWDSKNKVVRPKSEWIIVNVTPIIEQVTFDSAAALRKERHVEWKNGRAYTSPLLLVGLLRCSKCGSLMISSTGKGGRYTYYCCGKYLREGKSSCSGTRMPVQPFEQQIVDEVLRWERSVENVQTLIKEIRKALQERRGPVSELRQQLKVIETKLTRYFEAFEDGSMDSKDASERIRDLKQQKDGVEAQLMTKAF